MQFLFLVEQFQDHHMLLRVKQKIMMEQLGQKVETLMMLDEMVLVLELKLLVFILLVFPIYQDLMVVVDIQKNLMEQVGQKLLIFPIMRVT